MGAFFTAELKDKFLEYATEREDYFQIQLLYDEFLRPNYSINFVYRLLQEILDYDPGLLDVMSANGTKFFMISATSYTNEFLELGGFKGLYVQEEEKWDSLLTTMADRPTWGKVTRAFEKESKAGDLKKERWMIYGLLSALALSFTFTLYSLVTQLIRKDKNVSAEMFESRFKKLQSENEILREELRSLQAKTQSLEKEIKKS